MQKNNDVGQLAEVDQLSKQTQKTGKIHSSWRLILLIVLALLILPIGMLGFFVGSRTIDPSVAVDAVSNYDPSNSEHLIIRELRIPRCLIAIVVGASLGLAGALMQSLTRNALAEPGTLGVNAGAAAGVVIGLLVTGGTSITVYVWFAFAGAALSSILVHRLGRVGEAGVNPVRLVLAGAGLTVTMSSLTTLVIISGPPQIFESMRGWATGSLDGRGWAYLPVPAVALIIGLVLCLFLSGPLNSVSLGTDLARALGVNISATWSLTNVAIIVLAGAATAAVGPIAFVGLASPHIARSLVGPDHRWVFPYSAVIAALILLLADILGRTLMYPAEVGAGIMTALIGAPFFIWLIRRGKVSGL